MGDREHRAARGRAAQSLQHTSLRFGIQIGGDLIQQQHGGVCGGGTGNGQQLPLALREDALGTDSVITLRQSPDGSIDPGQCGGIPCHFPGDLRGLPA